MTFALQNGNRVGVTFNEVANSTWATNPANSQVNGQNPSRAVLQTNGSQVALWVNPLVGESFTLNANNLADPLRTCELARGWNSTSAGAVRRSRAGGRSETS